MNAKLHNVESAMDSARNAMETHAVCGLYTDRPVERDLRDAYHIFAPAGTSDIQLLRLGEIALGQSKGQWSERLAHRLRTSPTEATSHKPVTPHVSGGDHHHTKPHRNGTSSHCSSAKLVSRQVR
jgi:hypothetical protein